ncbi:hypothetical protein RRG08_008286 [Elysia crispata]|uniref:Uncharacterized protein n=1 Tax=Elysia crispata TaxID=231223 RepID=A0AAE1DJU9_9GAST|nr:hypothetical protein RRG08_008286 [Elysia crispata]
MEHDEKSRAGDGMSESTLPVAIHSTQNFCYFSTGQNSLNLMSMGCKPHDQTVSSYSCRGRLCGHRSLFALMNDTGRSEHCHAEKKYCRVGG